MYRMELMLLQARELTEALSEALADPSPAPAERA